MKVVTPMSGRRGDHAVCSVIYSRNATRPLESVVITNSSERPCGKMTINPTLFNDFMKAEGGEKRRDNQRLNLGMEQKCGAVGQNCQGHR